MSKMLPKLACFDTNLALTHTKQLKYIRAHTLEAHARQLYIFMTSKVTRQLSIMVIP